MKSKATYGVVFGALIAGTSGVIIKNIHTIDATSIAWFRTTVPTAIVFIWMIINGVKPFHGNYPKLLVGALINSIRIYLYLIAFIYTSIGNAVILFYTWPIMVAILGFLFLGEKVDKYQTFLLVLTFLGIVLAYSDKPFTFENNDFLGMLAALGASLTNAATVVLFKSEAKNYHSLEMVFYQNILGAFIFMPFFILGVGQAEIGDIGLGTLFGLIAGIVVFGLFFNSLKYLSAATASTLMYLEVVSAVLFGYLFFDEVLSLNMVLGGILIMASNLLLIRFNRKKSVQNV
ncbi:DMT family transporter [Kriegella aquimaris]|uniref:EamA-like transporter family protein n=1 Tax=Kriegella aquimaris TaxID=192904 RepID=A0A1G9MIY9_9FLAO|nr:DMT family transporter [Kriegella aquimaris]SDL74053.1 EamA-like transporter family protein [Kriegella aquimaris]